MGSIFGLNITLIAGMLLQVLAMGLLTVDHIFLTVPYIMLMQGFSGIAKDLVKMSAKSSLKALNQDETESGLFKCVSILTGSKNAMKGLGFLLGGIFLTQFGFQFSMGLMAGTLLALTLFSIISLPKNLGRSKEKIAFTSLFSKSKSINILSLARFFLFGSRDIWFVIGLPVFLQVNLEWSYSSVGSFLASWIIGYGLAQTLVPKFITGDQLARAMGNKAVAFWTGILVLFPAGIALLLNKGFNNEIIIIGLLSYGIVFAVNSIIHSYLVLAYSNEESVSTDVGFYYMANAGGRLVGTLLSGWVFQSYGFLACLWWSVSFLVMASLISIRLPNVRV